MVNIMSCPICTELIQEDNSTLECLHTFCTDCIKSWFKVSKTCPICRNESFLFPEIESQSFLVSEIEYTEHDIAEHYDWSADIPNYGSSDSDDISSDSSISENYDSYIPNHYDRHWDPQYDDELESVNIHPICNYHKNYRYDTLLRRMKNNDNYEYYLDDLVRMMEQENDCDNCQKLRRSTSIHQNY